MPGYTHLQRAIPVTLGHHLLAWVEMLERDRARLRVRRRAGGAVAARRGRARRLDAAAAAAARTRCATRSTPSPTATSRSTTSTPRAVLFTHLSRIGEELVLWTTAEFGFARLPEDAATGSSMMPQKLNPDVAELARGKAGTAIGRLTGLLATVKGLPLAYDRDLQEDKPPVFAARRDVARRARRADACSSRGLEFDRERLAAACADPLLRATDAAEALVREGVPFRDAHEQVAATVRAGTFEAPAAAHRDSATSARRSRSEGALVVKSPLRLARRPRPPADRRPRRRPRSRRSSTSPPSSRPTATAAPAGQDARPLLRAAVDAHADLVRGRDRAARRRAVTLHPEEMQLSRGESLEDTGAGALALPRRARDPHALARRARGVGRGLRRSR